MEKKFTKIEDYIPKEGVTNMHEVTAEVQEELEIAAEVGQLSQAIKFACKNCSGLEITTDSKNKRVINIKAPDSQMAQMVSAVTDVEQKWRNDSGHKYNISVYDINPNERIITLHNT